MSKLKSEWWYWHKIFIRSSSMHYVFVILTAVYTDTNYLLQLTAHLQYFLQKTEIFPYGCIGSHFSSHKPLRVDKKCFLNIDVIIWGHWSSLWILLPFISGELCTTNQNNSVRLYRDTPQTELYTNELRIFSH